MEGLAQKQGFWRHNYRTEWKESENHGIHEYIHESATFFQFDGFIKGLAESAIENTFFFFFFAIESLQLVLFSGQNHYKIKIQREVCRVAIQEYLPVGGNISVGLKKS